MLGRGERFHTFERIDCEELAESGVDEWDVEWCDAFGAAHGTALSRLPDNVPMGDGAFLTLRKADRPAAETIFTTEDLSGWAKMVRQGGAAFASSTNGEEVWEVRRGTVTSRVFTPR